MSSTLRGMDARELRQLADARRALSAIATSASPAAYFVAPPAVDPESIRSLTALPGAFNPPTRAHLALADAARSRDFDRVVFCLGETTLDKDDSGLILEDRVLLLSRLASRRPRLGVVVHNRSLYAAIAECLRTAFPRLEDLAFVIGADKLPQLFEARYYDDMERSLEALFERARFLVAPRDEDDTTAIDRTLASPAARRYASRFESIPFAPRWRRLSATEARTVLASGSDARYALPVEVSRFLERTGAFRGDGRYARRAREIRALT